MHKIEQIKHAEKYENIYQNLINGNIRIWKHELDQLSRTELMRYFIFLHANWQNMKNRGIDICQNETIRQVEKYYNYRQANL